MIREALSRTALLTRQLLGESSLTDATVIDALCRTQATIVSDAANVSSPNGQTLVTTLVGQLLAMGCDVRLEMPDVALESHQPPLRSARLRSGIVDLASDLMPGRAIFERGFAPDSGLVFVIGDTPWSGGSSTAWRLGASGWQGWMAGVDCAVSRVSGEFPIGSLVAALLAAGEAYKAAARSLLPTAGGHWALREQLAPSPSAKVNLGHDDEPGEIDLGPIDLGSGGAICQASLHVLLRVPGLTANARVLEADTLALSNLNRYPLARRSLVGSAKVDVLRSWERDGFRIGGEKVRVDLESLPSLRPLADRVLVGVDHIPSRWTVQREQPRWLGIGATSSFTTLTSEHDGSGGCSGCLHPVDDDVQATIPTVSFVSYWAGLLVVARLLLNAMGRTCEPERQALCLTPLRLDIPASLRFQPVPVSPRCPVEHPVPAPELSLDAAENAAGGGERR